MNPDAPRSSREELEIRIVALLAGELPPEEAATLRAQIDANPELNALHARLRKAEELLREAIAQPEPAEPPAPAQLSAERRERLLAHFKAGAAAPTPKPQPAIVPIVKKRRDWSWVPMSLAAMLTLLVGASLVLPEFLRERKRSQATRVLEDLRIVDAAIDQTQGEEKKYRSFIIAQSRAPELNLYGTPRGTVWPTRPQGESLTPPAAVPPPPPEAVDRFAGYAYAPSSASASSAAVKDSAALGTAGVDKVRGAVFYDPQTVTAATSGVYLPSNGITSAAAEAKVPSSGTAPPPATDSDKGMGMFGGFAVTEPFGGQKTGVIDLNGSNSAVGNVSHSARIDYGVPINTEGFVSKSGQFNFNNGYQFGGESDAKTAITKTGAGTLTVTGANGYTGDTTISGGTTQSSNSLTFGGVLSGTGGVTATSGGTLTKAGTGSLVLNNNGGGVAGAVTASPDGITATNAPIILNGGTLDYAGRTIVNAGTFTTSDLNVSGVSSGVNLATTAGDGTFTTHDNRRPILGMDTADSSRTILNGTNTYTGGVTVNSGTLTIGSAITGTGVSSNLGRADATPDVRQGNAAIAQNNNNDLDFGWLEKNKAMPAPANRGTVRGIVDNSTSVVTLGTVGGTAGVNTFGGGVTATEIQPKQDRLYRSVDELFPGAHGPSPGVNTPVPEGRKLAEAAKSDFFGDEQKGQPERGEVPFGKDVLMPSTPFFQDDKAGRLTISDASKATPAGTPVRGDEAEEKMLKQEAALGERVSKVTDEKTREKEGVEALPGLAQPKQQLRFQEQTAQAVFNNSSKMAATPAPAEPAAQPAPTKALPAFKALPIAKAKIVTDTAPGEKSDQTRRRVSTERAKQVELETELLLGSDRLTATKKRADQIVASDSDNQAAKAPEKKDDGKATEYGVAAYNETRASAAKGVDLAWQRSTRQFKIDVNQGSNVEAAAEPPTDAVAKQRKVVEAAAAEAASIRTRNGILDLDPEKDKSQIGFAGAPMTLSAEEVSAQQQRVVELERQVELTKGLSPEQLQDGLKMLNVDDPTVTKTLPHFQDATAEKARLKNQGATANDPRIKALEGQIAADSKVLADQLSIINLNQAHRLQLERDKLSVLQDVAKGARGISIDRAEKAGDLQNLDSNVDAGATRGYVAAKNKYLEAKKVLGELEKREATSAPDSKDTGRIAITGNARTKDKVIRQESPDQPNDVFNSVYVDAAKARLMNTKSFSKVETAPAALAAKPMTEPKETLVTKEWNVPANLIPWKDGSDNDQADREATKKWLVDNGVAFNGNASAVYIPSENRLIVRETEDQINLVDTIIDFKVKEAAKKAAAPPSSIPQPEIQTRENAFSTFSLNVSDVSFKLAAAGLEQGHLPEAASVRSEEFINAFDYRDPEPVGAPLAFATERARYPFAQNRDLLRFSVKTAAAGRQPGRPLNIVLLLDKSGSMERADRVNIVREALRVLAAELQPQDKLSIVTFARAPRLWADGVAGDKAGEMIARVNEITPEGGTNLEAALDLGYATALRHYTVGSISRVVLFTDGAANLGDVHAEVLKKKVETHRKQGVAIDCFGIGWEGYNDDLLEELTRNGDGRYGFINTPEEAATNFAPQLAGALHVAAADVKVQVEFNPQRVTAYRQVGYAKHQLKKEQFRDNSVDAAEIGAAESGNALYVVEVNPRGEGDLAMVRVRFKVPGTEEYREHAWPVPFNGNAGPLEQASPALRLAGTAGAFSEMLAANPYAGDVTSDRLLPLLNGVSAVYVPDPRPAKLEWMIRQVKSLSGR